MTDQHQTEGAREAEDVVEKPDPGRTPDALTDALSGSDMGSDTRAGSLEGGAATGSEIDPDQDAINESLTSEGMTSVDPQTPAGVEPHPVKNTGEDLNGSAGAPAQGKSGEVDAATG